MSLITGVIPSMHNGVSQQSPLVRAAEQCEDQVNGWASLADGLGKRQPTEMVAKLLTTPPADALIHTINRDVTERFTVIATGGVIRVFDLAGVEKTVAAPGGWGYLTSATTPSEDISMMTVADYTFVVNRKKVCAMDTVGADATADPDYFRWLNREFGEDDSSAFYGAGLEYQYGVNPSSPAYVTGTVQSFSKLPASPAAGAVYAITGTDESGFKSYFVRYSGGVWEETYKPGSINAIDPLTMPHCLVREADGTFSFAPFSWAPRRVGSGETNPNPPFIGRSIQKMLFYGNRLGVLVDENVVLSCSGDFGNFWRNTVLDYVDSDMISVAATSTRVSILKDAVTFNDGVLLSSDQTQFSLTNGESGVGPTSLALRAVTNYEVNNKAGMVVMGAEVYFASEKNGWATVYEYTRAADSDALAASDITAHVPRYIPAGVTSLIPAVDHNALFVATAGDPGALYVYQFYWLSASEKAQSAWNRWDLGDCVVMAGSYVGGYLYLLVSRDDGLFIEKVNLQSGSVSLGCSHKVLLDRQTSVTGTYNVGTQRTTFNLPYRPETAKLRLVKTNAFTGPLSLIDPTDYVFVDPDTITVPGNQTAGAVIAGEQYEFSYEFSKVFPRRQGGAPITTGRTQLRSFVLNYRDTGFFRTSVAPYGTDPVIEAVVPAKLADFAGKVVGDDDLILNSPAYHSGSYTVQVYGQADKATVRILNDTHVQSIFVGAEWEALYWNRASA